MPKSTHDEEYDGYASETDDDNHRYDDDDDIEDEVDEDFREEDHDDSSSYKSDSETEPVLSGLQQLVPVEFVVCASFLFFCLTQAVFIIIIYT